MPARTPSYVIGIDVGGTNTDVRESLPDWHSNLLTRFEAVVLQNEQVVAWHKTPTTSDIQAGVELAIQEVVRKGHIPSGQIGSVKIGTTVSDLELDSRRGMAAHSRMQQFINAVLEQDRSKLDKVAVIRLCGPYSQRSPPFGEQFDQSIAYSASKRCFS